MIFFGISFTSLLAFAILSWLVSSLVLIAGGYLERAFRWSATGSSSAGYLTSAARYVALESALARIHRWTGVQFGVPSEPPERLPRDEGYSLARPLIRSLFALPFVVGQILRLVWACVRYPAGAYVLAGAIWMQFRPDLDAAVERGKGVYASLAAPQGLAVLAVIFAAVTVILDHGLTPRLRGRNVFRQQRAAGAESTLCELHPIARSLTGHLEDGLKTVVRTSDRVIGSAVEHITQNSFTVQAGRVVEVPTGQLYVPRGTSPRPDWDAKEPLRNFALGPEPWDPSHGARQDLRKLNDLLSESEPYRSLMQQVPRPGRALLWECGPLGLPRSRTGGLPVGAYLLSREHLEKRGRRIVDDHRLVMLMREPHDDRKTTQLRERLDQLVRDSVKATEDAIWRASLLHAKTSRFVAAVGAWRQPVGWWQRLGTRLG